jgi:hypothetical protein
VIVFLIGMRGVGFSGSGAFFSSSLRKAVCTDAITSGSSAEGILLLAT